MTTLLCNSTLAMLPGRALDTQTPICVARYPRQSLEPQVVHLGLGAFHRAHQALVFDRLLASGDTRWGITGVSMRNPALADTLTAQDGLYSVQARSAHETHWHVPGSVLHTLVASRTRADVVAALAAPATRWVTLTVTEKGYTPALAALLVDALAVRHANTLAGLTIASCDNLSSNGQQLQALCLQAAKSRDSALVHWMQTHCAFPCSMVDRIVPAATAAGVQQASSALGVTDHAALCTEVFWEWVLQNHFADPSDAAALAAHGVLVVDDVTAFEEAKLRMLNASHTLLALAGVVLGQTTIAQTIALPAMHTLVARFMTHCAMPTLTRPHLLDYRAALLARFANPHVQHSVHQVASDSSLKIPLRWLPLLHAALLDTAENSTALEPLAFALALWIRYLRGSDDVGQHYTFNDPNADTLQALAQAPDIQQRITDVLGFAPMWGSALSTHPAWHSHLLPRMAHWLALMQSQGLKVALDAINATA